MMNICIMHHKAMVSVYQNISLFWDHRVCIVLKKEAKDIKLMLTLFDSILKSFVSNKRNCIDLRANGVVMAICWQKVCFTKCLTHYKSTKLGDYKTFSPLRPIVITPNKVQ
jgi:hypothetical protein